MARHHLMKTNRGGARRALHRRLREEDPDHRPPAKMSAKEVWRERLLLFGLFLAFIALIVIAAIWDI
ncbi:hypothetical protein [Pararhodobacter oceanensis]|uniref:hypothetical protein n=1 Tax=Pararhodobacter oceanensis TaxID=2172121 RepID=UPI003A8F9B7E